MSKTKTPVLSLEARGSISDSLTFAKRRGVNIVEKKPIPAYRQTLPQMYQRWLYEDYAYLWRQQSAATKQEYASAGVRHHLTGFQYWMKYQLTNLPDIAGWWKLDDNLGATCIDSSRNQNTGTIIGASPATGLIDGCLDFDGINDYVNCGDSPSLRPTTAITILAFIRPRSWGNDGTIIRKGKFAIARTGYNLDIDNSTDFRFLLYNAKLVTFPVAGYSLDTWIALAATWETNTPLNLYINADLKVSSAPWAGPIANDNQPCIIGREGLTDDEFDGLIDHVIIYNRTLDQTEITRHSLRRYPL